MHRKAEEKASREADITQKQEAAELAARQQAARQTVQRESAQQAEKKTVLEVGRLEADEQKAARSAAIQESMVGAMLVPEETQKMILDVFASMEAVRDCVGASIASDLASGAALLLAGAEGAFLNVRINAADLKDRPLAEATMARATAARDEIRSRQAAIAAQVDEMLS